MNRAGEIWSVVRRDIVVLGAIGIAACSSSSSPDMPDPAGGDAALGQAGGSGGQGGAGGQAGATHVDPCSAGGTPTAIVSGVTVDALRLSGNDLVFIDDKGGTGVAYNSRSIRKVAIDGSAGTLVYTGPADKQIVSLGARADTVYFLQNESTIVTAKANLYRIAKSGGTAERVSPNGPDFQPDAVLFAVDATQAYVQTGHDIVRVALSSGEQAVVVASFDGVIDDPQLVGDTIWFSSLHGLDGVFSVAASASAATPTRAGMLECGPNLVSVTSNGIFCGIPGGVTKSRLDGTGSMSVADAVPLNYAFLQPSPPDGDVLYIYGGGPSAPIYRLPSGGGTLEAMACDRGQIGQFAYGPDAIYWSEKSYDTGSALPGIYRLPKP